MILALDMTTHLTVSATARRLNLSESRVRQLDTELRPDRDSSGRRIYRPDRVDAVAERRAQRKGASE